MSNDIEARVAALEETVRQMQALAKGERGEPGKDGRDGRDGKTLSPARLIAALRNVGSGGARGSTLVNFDPHITVMPADVHVKTPDVHVSAPEIHVAAPNVHVEPQVEARVRSSRTITKHKRDATGEIIESVAEHIGDA